MNWIKTFEELKPEVYRNAGNKLMGLSHKEDRGRKLKDYGSIKEWGFYNLNIITNFSDSSKAKFTKPTAKFSLKKRSINEYNMNTRYNDISVEDMLDLWENGERELYFGIDFYFEPLEETKKSYIGSRIKSWEVPLFSFTIGLSSWIDSLEDYNDPEYWDEGEEQNFKKYSLIELYGETADLCINLAPPQVNPYTVWSNSSRGGTEYYNYGIFSDRNSAFKFKKLLPTIITDKIIEDIWGVFSLLGDSKNFKRCIHALKYGVRVNNLYDDTDAFIQSKAISRWFITDIADIKYNIDEVAKVDTKTEEDNKKEQDDKIPKPMWYQSRT